MINPMQASDVFARISSNAVEAFALCAEANEKILREMVDLSATAAKEGVRLYAELQASAVEAVKDTQGYLLRRQSELGGLPKEDPLAFFQKTMLESVEGAQKAFKLLEGNAQAMTRSAERLQVSSEQAAKEIQATFVQLAGKVKTVYAPLV